METVFEFLYNPDTFESAPCTISVHKTRKGAEMAMAFHRQEKLEQHNRLLATTNGEDLHEFGYSEYWGVNEVELLD